MPRLFSLSRRPLWEKIVIIGLGLVIGASGLIWWNWDSPIQSPLDPQSVFRFLTGQTSVSKSPKVIYGFLPYWNLAEVTLQPELTHLSYFSLGIGGDGGILTRNEDNLEPGYTKLQSDLFLDQLTTTTAQPEIVITQFNNDDIVSFLNSPSAHQRFFNDLDQVLLSYPFRGVNIDIEYTGEVTDTLRVNLVKMISELRAHLNQRYQHLTLSIDLYASAGAKYQIWDVPAIAAQVDYLVVMAYDFHRRSSVQAGPVAPLFGGKKFWDSDITEYLRAYLQSVPANKILLGIPFYGYEWQTTSRDAQAHTFPDTGATASFKRIQGLLVQRNQLQVQEHWNEEALSPYISYLENNQIYVVYFENSRSISYKLDLVNQLDLAGVAIWALGYEGHSRELWDVLNRKFSATVSPSSSN